MVKFLTTYLQAKFFRTVWTIAGILCLALIMTPRFFPADTTEISQTVVDSKKSATKALESQKSPQKNAFWARIQKILQARTNSQHSRTTAKKL